jgi:endonuclease YncB( thermonuclease family)
VRVFLSVFIGICITAVPGAAYSRTVVSELQWMGTGLSTADEWLELVYIPSESGSLVSQLIGGWFLTVIDSKKEEKTIFTFPEHSSIGSGQYIIVSNYDAGNSWLSQEPDFVSTSISLPNTKLFLRLYNSSGALVDLVDDGIGVPFAGENASGTGTRRSMERVNLTGSGGSKENWATAETFVGFDDGTPLFGTPGFPRGTGASVRVVDPPDTSSGTTVPEPEEEPVSNSGSQVETGAFVHPNVYITEVLSNPIGKDSNEWIELGNLGTGSVSIAGWILDEGNSPSSFQIPKNRTLSGAWPPKVESGFTLNSGEHVSFRKTVTALPLGNKGENLTLMSGSTLIDSWDYFETAEEISYGRSVSGSGTFQSFCVPTEGLPNTAEPLDPSITIQSGETQGAKKVSINLQAEVLLGSLASAQCSWDFGDGFVSESCNPPSHTFSEPGLYTISLSVRTHCENTVERVLQVEVLAVAQKTKKKQKAKKVSEEKEEECKAQSSHNILISEFLPNPYGEEVDEEWIELSNKGNEEVSLCGWLLDDEEGGSKPYIFNEERIEPGEFLLLPRSQTKIALNNNADTVRLFAGSENLVAEVTYVKGVEGEVVGLRDDGLYVWSPYPTPSQENRFRGAERRFPTDTVIVSAALPNPVGKDTTAEWIELANVSKELFDLSGWLLDNKEGGSKPYVLSGIILLPNQIRRFSIQETKLNLVNTVGSARLLDPDGYVVSMLSWTEAVDGRIYRPPVLSGERIPARVLKVIDGDTIDIVLTDIDNLDRVPSALKRKWLGMQGTKEPSIRVRLIGIDTPETVHPSKPVEEYGIEASNFVKGLIEGRKVELKFDTEMFDKYERLLAYVYRDNGELVQAKLLRSGLAYAYLRFPFLRSEEFSAYEKEARTAKLGLWSSPAAEEIISLVKQGVEQDAILEEVGLTLSAHPLPGLVLSGSKVTFTPSLESVVFLSVHSGAFTSFSGSYTITENSVLRAYAERGVGTGAVRSETLELVYVLPREHYAQEVFFSEVYPSPIATGSALQVGEWVELQNFTAHDVPLAGWILDDIPDGGSKPWKVTADVFVPASGSVLLLKEQTGIALNNDGDIVRLLSPDGELEIRMEYPKLRKGRAYALVGHSWCTTDTPTPYEQNICTNIVPIKRAKAHTRSKKIQKVVSRKVRSPSRFLWERYRNIVPAEEGETHVLPVVWQSLQHLEKDSVSQKKSSGEAEALIISLLFLPALRLLTL